MNHNDETILKKIKEITNIASYENNCFEVLSNFYEIILESPSMTTDKLAENCKKQLMDVACG